MLAAITEKIGIHAVFGAFVAGCILRQVPRLRAGHAAPARGGVGGVFAPVFFGLVGPQGRSAHARLAARSCSIVLARRHRRQADRLHLGGLLGRMTFWESLSIGVAMNARGAMELVVALIGLTLGILNPAMFAIIVVMAIVTSFMAPIGLRLTLRKVKMTAEEQARMPPKSQRGLFDPSGSRC